MDNKDKSAFDFELPTENDPITLGDDSELSFEQSKPENNKLLDEEILELTETVRFMDWLCIKCGKKTEVDLEQMPEDGFLFTCPSCDNKIQIQREASACRAKQKSCEIYCANCGNLLDKQAHCHSCGESFPDYFAAFDPREVHNKARAAFISSTLAAIRDFKFSFNTDSSSSSHGAVSSYSPQSHAAKTSTTTPSLFSGRLAVLAVTLIVSVAIVFGGVFAYNSYKTGKIYAENYFKALYCMKTGIDANLKICASIKSDWEKATASGLVFSPTINSLDEVKSAKLRGEIEKYMHKMTDPPARFSQANESLIKFNSVYLDTDALVKSKPSTIQGLGNSINTINKKVTQTSTELKSNLPDTLKKELEEAKMKYRGLEGF